MSLTIAGRILLASDESFGVEQILVWTSLHFVDDVGLEVNIQGPWHMFTRASLGEECTKTTVVLCTGDATVRLGEIDEIH